ncbi:MAG: RNA polymerase sigma factor, partial [Xanthomonadales bacterium]|nr:RNA polymerase sigma factor [Xanthomonadales bacterium]
TIERLYRELEAPLFNIALRWTWVPALAQELVQDAFMKLWSRRLLVRKDTASAYLYKTVLNLGRKHARRRTNWWRVQRRMPDQEPEPGPEAFSAEAEIRQAIDTLPDDQREVLLLCEFSGLSQREIGALLGIPAGTVGSRRHHALEKLKREMKGATG